MNIIGNIFITLTSYTFLEIRIIIYYYLLIIINYDTPCHYVYTFLFLRTFCV